MKNNILKFYIIAFYISSTFVTFAQPGADDETGTLEGSDTSAAPIDDYVWVLAAIALVYVFFKIRAFALQGNTSKE